MGNELEELRKKCLKKDGKSRKRAKAEDLKRLVELQADEAKATAKAKEEADAKAKAAEAKTKEEVEVKPETAKGVSRITTEEDGDKLIVKVAPGEPMSLFGKNQKGEGEIICLISSHGGKVRVPKGKFTDFRLDPETTKYMTFKPPPMTMGPMNVDDKPVVIKKGKRRETVTRVIDGDTKNAKYRDNKIR